MFNILQNHLNDDVFVLISILLAFGQMGGVAHGKCLCYLCGDGKLASVSGSGVAVLSKPVYLRLLALLGFGRRCFQVQLHTIFKLVLSTDHRYR